MNEAWEKDTNYSSLMGFQVQTSARECTFHCKQIMELSLLAFIPFSLFEDLLPIVVDVFQVGQGVF